MKGTRILTILLALGLILGMAAPAGAEVMTIGVYFRGVLEAEDGTATQVPLSGSFRVLQGGLDRGVIQAGETTVTVDGSDPVILMPMAETIDSGWDLTGARTTVEMSGGNVTVPILVPRLTENTVAVVPATETVTQAAESEGEEPSGEAEGETDASETAGTVVPTAAITPSRELNLTPVPSAEPTAEPVLADLTATAETGTFHVKAFYDSNSNGACSIYEKGVAGVQIYLVSEEGQVVTGGTTNSEGEITLAGVAPGKYRIRAFLSEDWGFNRQSKDVGLNNSIMNFSNEGTQDSDLISVSAGETVERGVGLLKGVVVDGVCWLDENADGIMGANEPRIPGVRITLSGQKNGLEYEAYSDENGYWKVIRLRAGYYDFSAYAPDDLMFTRYSKTGGKNRSVFTAEGKVKATKTLDLNDGKNQLDQNIGFTWQASVSGRAFLDANYNGLYDEGELPLAGVKVTAIKQVKDEEIAVAYTDENGEYKISGLRGNTYRIRAVLPDDGSNFTIAVSDLEGNHFVARENRRENFWKDFVLNDGEARTVNVGVIYYGSVSGTVYMDDDFSGTMTGNEKVAQGISVTLLDGNGTAVGTQKTGARGTYSFTGLTPGQYSLRMTAESGYAFTRQGEGNVMLNLNGGEGYSESFYVALGESVTGKDAGMIRPGTVKGVVFADANDNGRRDSGETGLAGTAVRLMSEAGVEFSALLTESGEFLFDAVMPGRYYLEYQLPEGAIFAKEGGENTIFGENGIGRGEWFDFKTAEVKEASLCGGLTLGKISGIAFRDHDGSGTQDAGDSALADVIIVLTPSRGDLEPVEAVSDENGIFELTDLHPDTYRLRVELPEGMVTGRIAEMTLPLAAGKADQEVELPLAMGQQWLDQKIGAVVPGALRGVAWLDENNNGLREEGEQTPAGMVLVVTDEETGEVFQTLRTDETGAFGYEGMIPGTYRVTYQMDENSDLPPAGDNTFARNGNTLEMTGIALAEGETREGLTLGLVKYTSMGGMVWIDRGTATEPLAGAVISLEDGEGRTLRSETTGEDGQWRFEGLMPGDYRITAKLPEGTVVAEPDDERLQTGLISVIQNTSGRQGSTDLIALKMGQDQLSMNIGSVLPGTIGDYCWLDLNGNGWQDGGELGIPHVKIELVRNGVTMAETETDQYGLYFFREVYPAVYTLKVTAPAEVKPTQKRTDIYLIVSSLLETTEETAYTEEFAVASDSTNFNIDLGYVLRTAGVYPPGYGEQETMDWSKSYENSPFK